MNWNWNQSRKQKHQFRSYYCADCRQNKPCQLLTGWDSKWQSYCCSCFYENEQQKAQEHNSYEIVYQQKVSERKTNFQQYQLLKNYPGCSQCGSKEVDAYSLYEENKLVCSYCLVEKTEH